VSWRVPWPRTGLLLRQLTEGDHRVIGRLDQIDDRPLVQRRAAGNGQERNRCVTRVGHPGTQRAGARRTAHGHRVKVLARARRGQRQRACDTAAEKRASEAARIVDRHCRHALCPRTRDARLADRERVRRVVVQGQVHRAVVGHVAASQGLVRCERSASQGSRVTHIAQSLKAGCQGPVRRGGRYRPEEHRGNDGKHAARVRDVVRGIHEGRHAGRGRFVQIPSKPLPVAAVEPAWGALRLGSASPVTAGADAAAGALAAGGGVVA